MEVMGEAITTPTTPHSFLLPFATCGGEIPKASVCGAENLSRINLVQCPAATIGATPLSLFSVFTTLCTLSRTLHLSLRFLPSQMIDRSLSTHRLLFAFVVSLNSLVHLNHIFDSLHLLQPHTAFPYFRPRSISRHVRFLGL